MTIPSTPRAGSRIRQVALHPIVGPEASWWVVDRRRGCGPCRQRGNRRERDSHPGLDGAQNAPPTTAHKPVVCVNGKDT